jgi:flagellar basal-body rod protein FlgB
MPVSFQNAFGIHERALVLKARRTQLLASNLANADTPNYKARDIDFKSVLNQSPPSQRTVQLEATHAQHIRTDASKMPVTLLYRVPEQASLDGNTVDSKVEQAQFAENAVQYQASLTILGARIRGLRSAIRGE